MRLTVSMFGVGVRSRRAGHDQPGRGDRRRPPQGRRPTGGLGHDGDLDLFGTAGSTRCLVRPRRSRPTQRLAEHEHAHGVVEQRPDSGQRAASMRLVGGRRTAQRKGPDKADPGDAQHDDQQFHRHGTADASIDDRPGISARAQGAMLAPALKRADRSAVAFVRLGLELLRSSEGPPRRSEQDETGHHEHP